jgi:hypothetical protein
MQYLELQATSERIRDLNLIAGFIEWATLAQETVPFNREAELFMELVLAWGDAHELERIEDDDDTAAAG